MGFIDNIKTAIKNKDFSCPSPGEEGEHLYQFNRCEKVANYILKAPNAFIEYLKQPSESRSKTATYLYGIAAFILAVVGIFMKTLGGWANKNGAVRAQAAVSYTHVQQEKKEIESFAKVKHEHLAGLVDTRNWGIEQYKQSRKPELSTDQLFKDKWAKFNTAWDAVQTQVNLMETFSFQAIFQETRHLLDKEKTLTSFKENFITPWTEIVRLIDIAFAAFPEDLDTFQEPPDPSDRIGQAIYYLSASKPSLNTNTLKRLETEFEEKISKVEKNQIAYEEVVKKMQGDKKPAETPKEDPA